MFNSNIKATILQAGFLSKFFNIKRGCKQGDPIAPYLFIICAQILFVLINDNSDIKGIKVGTDIYKITQFADDTTLILDGSEGSLLSALNTIEIFGTVSGLKMNKSKTKLIWMKKISKEKISTNQNLEWGVTEFTFLGIHFSVDLNKMAEINYSKAVNKIEKLLNGWNRRCLTPIGKITVIKTLAVSQLNHIIVTCPTGGAKYIYELEKKFYAFLWDGKPDKIKRINLTQNYQKGGLKMINLGLFIKAMKSTWIRRKVKSPDSPWATLFRNCVCPDESLFNLAPHGTRLIVARAKNDFWNEVTETWDFIYNTIPKKTMDIFLSPVWHNPMVKKGLFKHEWYNKGISVVGDLINFETGKVKSKTEIERTYSFKIKNFLDYFEVRDVINKFLHVSGQENKILEKPSIPNHLSFLLRQEKGCKIYIIS